MRIHRTISDPLPVRKQPATMEEVYEKWHRRQALANKAFEPLVWAFALILAPAGFFALACYENRSYPLAALGIFCAALPLIGAVACVSVFKLEKRDWWATVPTLPAEFDWSSFQQQFSEYYARR